jgi:hypothetical protein
MPASPHRPSFRRSRNQHPCWTSVLLCLLLACGLAASACACSLPVFRFALDRWAADTFRLFVFEEDAMDPEVAKFLRNFGSDSGLNLEIQRTQQGPSRLLRPTQGDSEEAPLWQGRVTEPWLRTLGNSAVSTELVKRLLAGDSAVWVLVESGSPEMDQKAAGLLEKRLSYLQQAIQIPPADPNDLSSRPGPGPELTVRFSLVRLRRGTGPPEDAEGLLRASLAGPHGHLAAAGGPWIAAVFGRGRVLGAWSAEDFGNEQIDEICLFLSGACSCQVKRQNPGWDLLLNIDWEERLRAIGHSRETSSSATASSAPSEEPLQPGSRARAGASAEPETVRIEPNATPDGAQLGNQPPQHHAPPRIVALPLAMTGLLLLAFASRNRLKRPQKK